jgi:hypothetical protein
VVVGIRVSVGVGVGVAVDVTVELGVAVGVEVGVGGAIRMAWTAGYHARASRLNPSPVRFTPSASRWLGSISG